MQLMLLSSSFCLLMLCNVFQSTYTCVYSLLSYPKQNKKFQESDKDSNCYSTKQSTSATAEVANNVDRTLANACRATEDHLYHCHIRPYIRRRLVLPWMIVVMVKLHHQSHMYQSSNV